MKVAVPAEVKNNEFRVAITPAGVHELVVAGHQVFIQAGAGVGSAISDAEYVAQGATICPDAIGNRAFCRHGQTCLMPERSPTAIASAALTLLDHPALADTLARNGQAEAQSRSLSAERSAYLAILKAL